MLRSFRLADTPRPFVITLGLSLVYLFILVFLNEAIIDQGDGIGHHQIAHFSWKHRWLFLNHWGKPIYTLLSSPFAQFGMKGSAVFNVLVFGITAVMLLRVAQVFRLSFTWLIPLLLLASPEYTNNVLAGLTEVLFAAFVVAILWQLLQKNWKTAALIASFIPFVRSEGQLLVVLLFPVLIWLRQWKAIPLLFVGFVFYGIIGQLVIHDFWWYFTNDPYKGFGSVYGSGPWHHFVFGSVGIFGAPLLVVFVLGCFYLTDRLLKGRPDNWLIILFALGTFAGIYVTHSVLWAKGIKGSLGLLRVIVCVFPLAIPVMLYAFGKINLQSPLLRRVGMAAFMGLALLMPYYYYQIPAKKTVGEKLYGGAGMWLKSFLETTTLRPAIVSVHNSVISHYAGFDTFDKDRFPNFWQIEKPFTNFGTDDLIVWDSQFGAVEGGLECDTIARYNFNLLRRFMPGAYTLNMRGMSHEVRIYTRHPLKADTVLVKEVVYENQVLNSLKSNFVALSEITPAWFGNDWNGEFWFDCEVVAEAETGAAITQMNFVMSSKNNVFYNSPAIPVEAGKGPVTFNTRIYLPQIEASQFPYSNNLWLQGTGIVKFQKVKISLKKRVVKLL